MAQAVYCLPVDVLRKFDPTLSRTALEDDDLWGDVDLEKVRAEIEDASSEFDDATDNPQRLTFMGRGGTESYEYHDAELRRYQGGVKVFLRHRNVLPFDSTEGDVIEIRTGRDNWRDITDDTDRYRLNSPEGILQIFTRRVSIVGRNRRSMVSDNVRVKYRYGALGAGQDRPGQTVLSTDIQGGDTTIPVDEPTRLPREATGIIAAAPGQRGAAGTGSPPEYIHWSSADDDAGELLNVARGLRGTDGNSHSAGRAVHYCRMDIRKAVAGRVAVEMVRSDDIAANLATPDDNISHSDRIEQWNEDWETILGKFSEAHMI